MDQDHKYQLRQTSVKKYNNSDTENNENEIEPSDDDEFEYHRSKYSSKKSKNKRRRRKSSVESQQEDNVIELDRLPKNIQKLKKLDDKLTQKINQISLQYFKDQEDNQTLKSKVHNSCIPINADIRNFDFVKLAQTQLKLTGKLFSVIMMDPPWQLSTSQPSRGVAIAYSSLGDDHIKKLPIPSLQKDGLLFIWCINAKYRFTIQLMKEWGYNLVDELVWVKKTVNGKIAKGHGFYLQHAKENCLIGYKGTNWEGIQKCAANDIIWSQRRGQSQKPEEIYTYIEKLVPNGFYLEIFGRRNNLREKWVTIGNEI